MNILLFLLALAGAGCEKVIDVNLTEGAQRYVIEGVVTDQAQTPAEVRISQTRSFNDDNNFRGVSGATVEIQEEGGVSYPLTEAATGVYRSSAFTGRHGFSYRLRVTVGGNLYEAQSRMPAQAVTLDTLTVTDLLFAGDRLKVINPDYLDPAGLGNSYRLVQWVNGVQTRRVFVQNDELSDGRRITRPLVDPDSKLKSGDQVRADLLCIDPAVYRYWYSLDQGASGNGQGAAPANPETNLSGGALGYFSAHTVRSKTITIP